MSIRKKVLQSSLLITLAHWAHQLLRIGAFVILAHLLDPQAYGIVALAQTPIGLLGMIASAGILEALLATTADIKKAAFHALVLIGCITVVLIAILILSAPHYARAFGYSELTDLCRVMVFIILFDSLLIVPRAVLIREMKFGWIALASTVSGFCGLTVAIVMASLGYGYWSLASWPLVASAIYFVIVAWNSQPRMWLRATPWDRTLARQLGRYGFPLKGHGLLYYLHTNGDYLVVGKLFGSGLLGYYTQALRIASLPIEVFHAAMDVVLLPAFVNLRDDKTRLARAFLSSYRTMSLFLFPTAMGSLILAPELVTVLAGENWGASVPFLQIFAWKGLVRSLYDNFYSLFNALNRPHYNLISTLVVAATMALGMMLVVLRQLPAMAIAWSVVGGYAAGMIVGVFLACFRSGLPTRPSEFLSQVLPIGYATAVMVGLVSGAHHLLVLNSIDTATLIMLSVLVLTGIVGYGLALLIIKPALVFELFDTVLLVLGQKPQFQALESRRAALRSACRMVGRYFRGIRERG